MGSRSCEKIRENEQTRRLPVVVFTSSSEEEDMIKSYELGANSYVRKPVESEHFAEATKQLVCIGCCSMNLHPMVNDEPPEGFTC